MMRPSSSLILFTALGTLLVTAGGCGAPGESMVLVETLTDPTPIPDEDKDGFTELQGDCNDQEAAIYPEAEEGLADELGALQGDGLDNDCDGLVDEGTVAYDDDRDGSTELEGDCDDTDPLVGPYAVDGCDGIDSNCDGQVDEDAQDLNEPNDAMQEATNLGEISCETTFTEFNVGHMDDRDFFTFAVCEDLQGQDPCNSGCSFGISVELFGDIYGRDYYLKLYKDGVSSPIATLPSTLNAGVAAMEYNTVTSGNDGGTFFLEIGPVAETGVVDCTDDIRLKVVGTTF